MKKQLPSLERVADLCRAIGEAIDEKNERTKRELEAEVDLEKDQFVEVLSYEI